MKGSTYTTEARQADFQSLKFTEKKTIIKLLRSISAIQFQKIELFLAQCSMNVTKADLLLLSSNLILII